METKISRRTIVLLFISFSIALFFVARIIAGKIYESYDQSNGFEEQLFYKLNFSVAFISVYLMLLLIVSLAGISFGRKKENKEIYKGFLDSCIYAIIMLIIFVLIALYLFS